MYHKGQAEDPGFGKQKEQAVCGHGPIGVQRVIPDTATACVKNGVGQQVVQVYQDARKEYQDSLYSVLPVKKPACQYGQEYVDAVMQQEPIHSTNRYPVS
jgi:hypothetical protein